MSLPASGAISLLDIATEFGGTVPHSIDEYYGFWQRNNDDEIMILTEQ